jgi:alkylhydroperoxidase family enzyme
MTLADLARATRDAVFDGPGSADASLRRKIGSQDPPPELAALAAKVRDHAYRVTDHDVAALRSHYTDDQLFELIVAAAVGAAGRRLDRALAVLEEA